MVLLIMSVVISLISNLSRPKIPHNITLANGYKAQVTSIGQASPLLSLS
jgi:hypothetical protein